MIQYQIISRILTTGDISILSRNNITDDYFPEYAPELEFIKAHLNKYGNVPDMETFIAKFNDFEPIEVTESERYLVDTIREERLYSKAVPVVQKMAELLKSDANAATQYLMAEIQNLQPQYETTFVDIAHNKSRLEEFKERSKGIENWCIPTGFEELDDIIGGWEMGEEFVVFVARTNQGKSWIVTKTTEHAFKIGKNVGYISPEMSYNKLAYRVDTFHGNISNTALMRGNTDEISIEEYEQYLDKMAEHKNIFLVAEPKDFDRQITVSKLRNFIVDNNLDMVVVDGITYMTDERYKRGDTKTTSLTNISEDLMELSIELKIPIIVVVQSNRGGVKEDDDATPELEDIRDSDGISHNASKVISLRQKDGNLIMVIKKSRYGRVGDRLTYHWIIDRGEFEWMANATDAAPVEKKEERKRQIVESVDKGRKIVF